MKMCLNHLTIATSLQVKVKTIRSEGFSIGVCTLEGARRVEARGCVRWWWRCVVVVE